MSNAELDLPEVDYSEEDEEDFEEEEEKEMDSDLMCGECGNMKFIIRYIDGVGHAICPECGETIELD